MKEEEIKIKLVNGILRGKYGKLYNLCDLVKYDIPALRGLLRKLEEYENGKPDFSSVHYNRVFST